MAVFSLDGGLERVEGWSWTERESLVVVTPTTEAASWNQESWTK